MLCLCITVICILLYYKEKEKNIYLVEDGSSKTFLGSMRRFISRRGCPSKFISDNGTVFRSQET